MCTKGSGAIPFFDTVCDGLLATNYKNVNKHLEFYIWVGIKSDEKGKLSIPAAIL